MKSNTATPTDPAAALRQTCLRLLARREHSRRELLDKLLARGYPVAEADAVIAEMSNRDWQNDDRYAQAFVRQRIEKGYGPLRIRHELQQRGIVDADIDGMAEDIAAGWPALLLAVYRRKYPAGPVSPGEWRKRSRFLEQRGFSSGMIAALSRQLRNGG